MRRGDRIAGRFEIVEEVARGGMGTVFRARDVRSRAPVAVKLVATGGDDGAVRFEREAATLATLEHDAIVRYVAHGVLPDVGGYLVMEWIEGETLSQRARRGMRFGELLAIARATAGALAALHAAGIVHRDVKPANIMLIGDTAKLVDFGIARAAGVTSLTRTGSPVGTAGYMAPEQARGDRDVDTRADVFALGCILYEYLSGEPAFRADTPIAMHVKVLVHDPARVRALNPSVPAALDALIARMIDKDPAARPSAADVAAELAAFVGDGPPPPPPRPAASDETAVSGPPSCAVLAAGADAQLDALAELRARWPLQRFDSGVVATLATPADAGRLALALQARLPDALVAIGCGRSASDAIDRGARLIEQLAIAASAGGATGGAWVEGAAAERFEAAFVLERHGTRAKLVEGRA